MGIDINIDTDIDIDTINKFQEVLQILSPVLQSHSFQASDHLAKSCATVYE